MANEHVHEGRNIKRFRELLGVKQDIMAASMGNDWTQKKVSQLESKWKIEPAILEEVSAVLKVPVEAFQNFDEEQAVNIITNTFHDNANSQGGVFNQPITNVNPLEKWVEAVDEIKKLYERLLSSEQQKVEMMQGMMDRTKSE